MSCQKVNIDHMFRALGDPTGRAIVDKHSKRPLSVSRSAKPFEINLDAVVQHLQVLGKGGLLHTENGGRVRTRRIKPAGLSATEQWIDDRHSIWERRFD